MISYGGDKGVARFDMKTYEPCTRPDNQGINLHLFSEDDIQLYAERTIQKHGRWKSALKRCWSAKDL